MSYSIRRSLLLLLLTLFGAAGALFAAESALSIKPLTEKKVSVLPPGDLYWVVEKFASRADAEKEAELEPLIGELDGSWWRFTLGPKGKPDMPKVAEIGPIPRIQASEYLLRINVASGKPGSVTPIHIHPGSEAFYVLRGQQLIRSVKGQLVVSAGQSEPGFGANLPMQVSSNGSSELRALVMFVVDAKQPFSSPACFPETKQ
ncbi:MAG TPA: cupin domain-containing protein [Opitutaceae bacterium]|nr:cupin domain-containing protein [Opitutaceae bacterium]